jgi:hypothetical protein
MAQIKVSDLPVGLYPTSSDLLLSSQYLAGAYTSRGVTLQNIQSYTNPYVNLFRLSLTSGVAVTTTDVVYAGAQTIYCTPYSGTLISLYNGSNWITYSSNQFSLAIEDSLTNITLYDVFCYANSDVPTLEFTAWSTTTTRATALVLQDGILCKSGALTRRYLGTFYNPGNQSSTVTISIAAPGVITYAGHGLSANAPVVFTTTGALPTGIVSGTTYYICSTAVSAMTANTFQISSTAGGSPITTSGTQSGAHTCTVPTYTEDSVANRYLWNYYNQTQRLMSRTDSLATWDYTTATTRQSNASLLNQLNFIIGISNNPVNVLYSCSLVNTNAGVLMTSSIGLDSITANTGINFSIGQVYQPVISGTVAELTVTTSYSNYVAIGKHYFSMLERSTAAGTTTWKGTRSTMSAIILG